ncbi:MAG: ABC transporter ATP-binding protein [Eubacteriales bacterium]
MIEVRNLTKKYGDNLALDNISFSISSGKVYGLLGPNGAGKTTTMNIITGCLAATSGTVTVGGHDIFEEPLEAKRHIGYLPEVPPLYTDMTPSEYLNFIAMAKRVDYEAIYRQVREVMELTQLEEVGDRLIRNLSKGYRQRVGIAQAMLGNPDVIILDEPTVGLDPKQTIEMRDLIRTLGEMKTVIFSSHILAEVTEVCERVIIIHRGKIVADDSLENLNRSVESTNRLHIAVKADERAVISGLAGIPGILEHEVLKSGEAGVCELMLSVDKNTDPREAIFFAMADRRCPIITMELKKSSLESVFLSLTTDTEDDSAEHESHGSEGNGEDEVDEDYDENDDNGVDDEDDESNEGESEEE